MRPFLFPPIAIALALMLALPACTRDGNDTTSADAAGAAHPDTPKPPNDSAAGQRIEADLLALADDAMEGRETGTPGYDRAAAYVAARFAEIGLQPAGDDGTWFQRIPMLASTRVPEGARLAIHRGGRTIELTYLDQFLSGASGAETDVEIEAPAVFVAHGVHAPHLGHDDLAGLDLRGKIVLTFPEAPAHFDDDMRAYYASQAARAEALAARGAVAWIAIPTPSFAARIPWDVIRATADKPSMVLVDDDGTVVDGTPGVRAGAFVNVTAVDLLFADTGWTGADLFAAADAGTLKGFDLPGTLTLAARATTRRVESRNVIGRLPGRDAALSSEHFVYTAHLDHMGIGEPVDGDAIHNGALDNALGVAIVLEAARELHAAASPPARSMLFMAVGAEEQGLLGSRWFVRRPTVPREGLVGNLNIDMPVLTAPTTDVVPIGAEHSTLKQVVEDAAAAHDATVSADPFPEQVAFVRSDQFAFVRAGIPAVYLDGGVVAANDAQDPKLAVAWFLRNCYHKPCDRADLPIHYNDAARMARIAAGIGRIVGDAPERPAWNEGNFFGKTFGADAAAAAVPAPQP
ncbi:M20/M25/M40 family metallo-hydrolase [Luteimonas aestuarii]|uniref:M20/M25/M40 family metallo-hydrolase n=1 Tax=Luteimonas aestuarii TaxID=453837 RepID=UPI001405106E|nr:M20/M25/M40 family metallo-hydrolase [Luteimonas aestuarii]